MFSSSIRSTVRALGAPALVPFLVLTAASCGKESAPERATTIALVATAEDSARQQQFMSQWNGMGTVAAQAMILDSLGPTPWVAFHRSEENAQASPGAVVVTDYSSGNAVRIKSEPAWTIRDVSSIRVDMQDDSTAVVVLLLARTRATQAFLAANADDYSGALLVNGYVMQRGSGAFFGDGEVPVPLVPSLPAPEAERFAAKLEAARVYYRLKR